MTHYTFSRVYIDALSRFVEMERTDKKTILHVENVLFMFSKKN